MNCTSCAYGLEAGNTAGASASTAALAAPAWRMSDADDSVAGVPDRLQGIPTGMWAMPPCDCTASPLPCHSIAFSSMSGSSGSFFGFATKMDLQRHLQPQDYHTRPPRAGPLMTWRRRHAHRRENSWAVPRSTGIRYALLKRASSVRAKALSYGMCDDSCGSPQACQPGMWMAYPCAQRLATEAPLKTRQSDAPRESRCW